MELRSEKDWTDYQLSKLTGIPASTVSSWSRGTEEISLANIEQVCYAFGISLPGFFESEEVFSERDRQEQRAIMEFRRLSDARKKEAIKILVCLACMDEEESEEQQGKGKICTDAAFEKKMKRRMRSV